MSTQQKTRNSLARNASKKCMKLHDLTTRSAKLSSSCIWVPCRYMLLIPVRGTGYLHPTNARQEPKRQIANIGEKQLTHRMSDGINGKVWPDHASLAYSHGANRIVEYGTVAIDKRRGANLQHGAIIHVQRRLDVRGYALAGKPLASDQAVGQRFGRRFGREEWRSIAGGGLGSEWSKRCWRR
jgi:hypothetical protein